MYFKETRCMDGSYRDTISMFGLGNRADARVLYFLNVYPCFVIDSTYDMKNKYQSEFDISNKLIMLMPENVFLFLMFIKIYQRSLNPNT